MANFDKSGMTQAGINLMGKAVGGATIQFTRLVLGDGTMTGEILDLKGVVSPKQNVDVTRIERNNSQCTVGGELLTSSVKQGFFWRECGLYAMDPQIGEILYNYAYSTKPDYIAASDSGVMEEILVSMVATVGSNTNVDITIDDSMVFATKRDVGDINKLDDNIVESILSLAKKLGYVTYEMFDVKCDGISDDGVGIKQAHEFANTNNLPVKCQNGKTYYILGSTDIPIMTDTDWSTSKFIINDDLGVYNKPVFRVVSKSDIISLNEEEISAFSNKIKVGTKQIQELSGYGKCLVNVVNSNKKQFIRKGIVGDEDGSDQCDQFVIDNEGNVENDIIWDFETVTSVDLYPVDDILVLKGGKFHSTGNSYNPDYWTNHKNININRSNVVISGLTHTIAHSADNRPYTGFIRADMCSNLLIENCNIQPKKAVQTSDGTNYRGNYAISFECVVGITLQNTESYSIDISNWGCMGGNYLKDLKIFNCKLSRVDSHKGVWNLTIKDSEIGNRGICVVGGGRLLVENTKCHDGYFLTLRSDYGSTWNGDIYLKDVIHEPTGVGYYEIFSVSNTGDHDFGYECMMGRNLIKVDGYHLVTSGMKNTDNLNLLAPDLGGHLNNTIPQYMYFMPEKFIFKDISVDSKTCGFRCIKNSMQRFFSKVEYEYEELKEQFAANKVLNIRENMVFEFNNVQLKPFTPESVTSGASHITTLNLGFSANDGYLSHINRAVPKFVFSNCEKLLASVNGLPCILIVKDCEVVNLTGVSGGTRSIAHLDNCVFKPYSKNPGLLFRINGFHYFFRDCVFYAPVLDGVPLTNEKSLITQIYEFMNYLPQGSSGRYITQLGKFSNCTLDPRIDLNMFGNDFEKVYNFKFGNADITDYPATYGITSLKPTNMQSRLPIGFEYYDTELNTFSKWNGTTWS